MSNAETFSGPINDWVRETKERMLAVRNDAVQSVIEVMTRPVARGGNMPVRDGFLRASGRLVIGDVPPLKTKRAPGAEGPVNFDLGNIALVLEGATIDDDLLFAFTAVYARRKNYGFVGQDSLGRTYNEKGRQFVGLAVQQWPQIVARSATKAQNAVANRAARPGMGRLAAVEAGL